VRIQSLSQQTWTLVEKVNSSGTGEVSGFLDSLGANKQREAARMTALFDRVARNGPRQGTAKCHQIQDDIWELIYGSLRILFAHDGNRLILCTSVNTNLRCPVFSEVRCPLFLGLRSHLFRIQVVASSLGFGVDRGFGLPSSPALRFSLSR
jgi:hypothetical protein